MLRPVWFRALIGIWSLWFAAMLSEPGALHSCPMHGSHTGHMAGMEHGRSGPHSPASKAHCTCLGDCCCAAPPATPPATIAVAPAARVVRATPLIVASADATPVAAPPYARPFANGPPTALLG